MGKEMVRRYWGKVISTAWTSAWKETTMRVFIIIGAFLIMLSGIMGILLIIRVIPADTFSATLNQTSQGLIAIGLAGLALIVLFALGVYRIPAEIDAEKTRRLELKAYEEIRASYFKPEETDAAKRGRLILGERPSPSLDMLITNRGGLRLVDATAKITDVTYQDPPGFSNPFRKDLPSKSLKWVVGTEPPEGKWVIAAGDNAQLQVACLMPLGFQWSLLDGLSRTTVVYPGRYRVLIELYGRVEALGQLEDINPQSIEVSFDFNLRSFDNVEIKKLPESNRTRF